MTLAQAAQRAQEAVRPARSPAPPTRVPPLAQQAGNRAFAALAAGAVQRHTIQRHEGPTSNEQAAEQAGGSGEMAEVASEATEAGATEEAAATPTTETGEATVNPGGGGTGTTGTGTAPLTGAARRTAIENTMRLSATGMWALGVVERWSLPVNYEYTGQGSFHQGGNIYINRSLPIGAAALVMMHECQHAQTFKSGTQANMATLSRAEFITRSIADEAEATVRQIEGLAVTQGSGADMSGQPINDALKQRYLNVFYAKGRELRAANPSITTAEVNAQCRTFARDTEVTNWFYDGTFVTSTNNNPYSVFYGLQWDAAHPSGS